MSRSNPKPTGFDVLRLKRALEQLGLNVTEATPETILDLYKRLVASNAQDDGNDRLLGNRRVLP